MSTVLSEPPRTKDKPERDKLPTDLPSTLVTSGTQRESRIDLVRICLEGQSKSSVFIYPSTGYRITNDNVIDIHPSYSRGIVLVSREFKDLSAEELDSFFMKQARKEGVVSAFDYNHKVGKIPITEHAYHESAYKFLRHVVTDLKA